MIDREWVGCNEDITKRDLLINNNIYFPEELRIGEDHVYGINLCLNAKKIKYLNNFYAKVYFSDNTQSVCHENSYIESIKGRMKAFQVTHDLKKQYISNNEQQFIDLNLDLQLIDIIGDLLRFNAEDNIKYILIKKIYDMELNSLDYKSNINVQWANIINKFIMNKKFKLVLLFTNLCSFLFEKKFFIKHFRNRNYTKLSSEELKYMGCDLSNNL